MYVAVLVLGRQSICLSIDMCFTICGTTPSVFSWAFIKVLVSLLDWLVGCYWGPWADALSVSETGVLHACMHACVLLLFLFYRRRRAYRSSLNGTW